MLYKDPTRKIIRSLYGILSGMTEAYVYSFVPNNKENPYIFIGDVQIIENQTSCFTVSGTFVVELFTGTEGWTGSLETPMLTAAEIKYRLKPDKGSILDLTPTHKMIYMRMVNDSGFEKISEVEKLYIDTIQYIFELQQLPGYTERVEADGGILESPNCVPLEYR